ncbi:MAG: TonB-dependent receptor [Putridiphycobacter sp.]|nr:TonB-dependent receptor [Putridiphycobacter sp.]
MKFLLLSIIVFCTTIGLSQTNFTLSGNIKDSSTGEDIIGARIQVAEIPSKGAITNVYGFYSLTLPAGTYTINYNFIGYQKISKKITLDQNITKNVELVLSTEMLQEVEVTGEKLGDNLKTTEMGVEKISVKDIESIPVLFGEQDIMKTMQLLPGVKSAGEGNSGFYVRGGGADQNLILLDEAPVYNASHLLGFFSVFNSDALKDVKLYKGGAPAEFGGRLSSVMDIKMKEGNSKKVSASGGIGLISSRLTLEAPIVKNKGSFILSGRRTYVDQFLRFSNNENLDGAGLYFYDFNAKANYRISDKDRVFVSGYLGRDQFKFGNQLQFDWGNITSTARWNHVYNGKLFGNATFIFSKYNYVIGIGEGNTKVEIGSQIQDFNFKKDFDYYLNSNNTISFGGNIIHHTFEPGDINIGQDLGFTIDDIPVKHSIESALYVSNDQKIGNRLNLTYGLRYSNFTQIGPGETYTFTEEGEIDSTTYWSTNEPVVSYNGLSPRLGINVVLNEKSSLKGGYSRTYQFMHLISNSTSATPTDIWLPSSPIIKPQIADQYSIGYFRNFKKNTIEFSAEAYYKDFQNVIDYRDGAEITLNPNVEAELLFGIGRAYGLELLAKKKVGNFTGWLSYTISKTENKIDGINKGDWFSAKQDRTHDISIVLMYKLNQRLNFSASWVYYTGNAVTFPSGKYTIEGQVINEFTERNGYRMPDYHRLDLGVTLNNKKTEIITDADNNQIEVPKKFESSWNFSVYNAYGRENAYSITFQNNEITGQTEAVKLALFKIIPSITYNFKF